MTRLFRALIDDLGVTPKDVLRAVLGLPVALSLGASLWIGCYLVLTAFA